MRNILSKVKKVFTEPAALKLLYLRKVVLPCDFLREYYVNNKKRSQKAQSRLGAHPQLDELRQRGIVIFKQFISDEMVASILEQLKPLKCYDRYRKFHGQFVDDFTIDTVPAESHTADFYQKDLLQIPEILAIANNSDILKLVEGYLGVKPVISNLSCWYSLPVNEAPTESQFFHRDKDDIKFLKLFIYLCDVDENGGPHIYVAGSAGDRKFRWRLRYQEHEVEARYSKEDILCLTANQGDAFVEDTFGLHKGTVPKKNRRLLLQVQYSVNPLTEVDYEPKEPLVGGYDPYINQCFFNQ